MIPLYQRHDDPQERAAVNRIIQTGTLSQGYYIAELERAFASYVGVPYAVAVSSCTAALAMCLRWINPDKVPVPAMTFVSVANEATMHFSGAVYDQKVKLEDSIEVGSWYELGHTGIIDAAHQVDRGMYKPGTYMCFSLYPGKPISGAEGGLIATSNKEFVQWAKTYRQCGRTAYGASYEVESRGIKANMTNLQACIGFHALQKLDENKKKLAEIRDRYNKAFNLNQTSDYCYRINIPLKINWYGEDLLGEAKGRDQFRDYMKENGVDTSIHFKPIYRFKAYEGIWNPKDFPNTEKEWSETVSIPFYPDLSYEDQIKVINLVKEWSR